MKIAVKIFTLTNSTYLTLNDETNEVKLNGKKINLEIAPFANRLLSIVSSWQERMINPMILDGIQYSVTIEKNGKTKSYEGRNKFPDNYREFMMLLQSENII